MRSHFVSSACTFFFGVAASSALVVGIACNAASMGAQGPDFVSTDADADVANEDGDAGKGSPALAAPSMVLVNGLIGGGKLPYDDVRVCFDGTPHPLPDAVAMPLSNYPGVARGTGVDLGTLPVSSGTLRVFRARDLRTDAAWVQGRMSCDSWQGSFTPTSIPLTLLMGPTLVVLVDDPNGPDGIQVRVGALPAHYDGTKGSLQLVPAEFSTFAKPGESLRVTLDANPVGSGPTGVLAQAPYAFATSGGPLDAVKVRFERSNGSQVVTSSFDQTLGSVQFLSDPTTTPSPFFDRRTNFALVLLGDEANAVTVDEKDLHFDGKGLHVVAIPYAAVAQ